MGSKSLISKPVSVPDIKKEATDIDMKDYAENTVKEVLGWYGYDQGGGGSSSDASSDEPENLRAPSPSSRKGSPKEVATSIQPAIPAGFMCCSWCQKVGSAKQFSLKSPNGNKAFCSEQCFTQSRRANFKRNKTCDWCRHVRHTVNYVDFQDGEHQLQFCSDKCLNQYKMNIFCTETQAHLEVHPHPQEASTSEENEVTEGNNNLITPDLWMRDCRSQSPDTDKSGTPPRIPSPLVEIKMSPSRSRYHPQRHVPGDVNRRKCRRSPKRSAVHIEQRRSPHSPQSPGSGGSPVAHPVNLRVPPTPQFHPGGFLPDQQRPIFFSPAILSPPHPDGRFGVQRHPMRKMLHPQGLPPPLLPMGRPMQQPPMFPMFPSNLLPPPTTLIPYPILLPVPIPIPIPIPLPGVKFEDLKTKLEEHKKKTADATSQPNKPNNNSTACTDKVKQEEQQETPSTTTNQQETAAKPANPPRKRKHIIPEQEKPQDNEPIKKTKLIQS